MAMQHPVRAIETRTVQTEAFSEVGTRLGRGVGEQAIERGTVDMPAAAPWALQMGMRLHLSVTPHTACAP